MSAGRRTWLSSATAGVILTAGLAGLVGCSRDSSDSTAKDTVGQSQSDKPKTPDTGTAGTLPTVADYIKQNNITETPVKVGDPNAPVVKIPIMRGWQDAGAATPPSALGAVIDTDPTSQPNPPSIVVIMAKLDGGDPAEILKLAPNEIRNLPEFQGAAPQSGKLANFDATLITGIYRRNGEKRLIGQQTVVIPGKDGLYVMQINANGTPQQGQRLIEATAAIGKAITITP